ncbi:c-type cytochrome [Cognatishimia activa]|uniref:Cytochrome c, mono-and diheme variants n=1 Tax=Cognatishimia activa TaxID=1715691 RepID=A0A0P1ITM6_9RHOB|nr:c-type cytochrome [Cognatishimia activa]CUI79115.1 Cytochrome c, mono-and diheme variants [Cognatishimia activa]CUK26834.1 Cytochrome c, mono-and diheme variants [Cognatishimia activa]
MTSRRILTLAAAIAATTGLAQDDALPGEEIYLNNCAACHGVSLDGKGVMAGVMIVKPKDLTRLSRNNDGAFPLFQVIQRIDGRDPLVSHGSPMPVYGDFFEGEDVIIKSDAGQPIATSAPVVALVDYLKAHQK